MKARRRLEASASTSRTVTVYISVVDETAPRFPREYFFAGGNQKKKIKSKIKNPILTEKE